MRPGFQKQIWANGAGDDWLQRNRAKLGERDVALDAIEHLGIAPESVLEVGCSNGWRLKKMREKYECLAYGIDPSEKACEEAATAGLTVHKGTADKLPFPDNSFDMVIYGYCLCFISPEDWGPLVTESDRVLKDGGHIVVYDFFCTSFVKRRIMNLMDNPTLEKLPVYLYNYDWPKLWSWHPAFKVMTNMYNLAFGEVATIIQKDYGELLVDFDETGERVE